MDKEQIKFDAFVRGLKGLPRVKAPEGLADEVLRAVREQAAPPHARILLFRAPALAMAAALLIAIGGYLFFSAERAGEPVAVKRVRFECVNPEASSVCLAGDFNQWSREECLLRKEDDGTWFIEVPLPPGTYQYQFLINGSTWTPDPKNPVQIDDGFGNVNSGIEI